MNKLITKFKLNRTDNARKWKHQEGGVIYKAPMLDKFHHNNLFTSLLFVKDKDSVLSRYYVPKFYRLHKIGGKINKKLYGGTVSDDIINQSNIVSPFITYTDNTNDYLKLKQQKELLDANRELLKLNKLYSFFDSISEYLSGILGNILLKKVDSSTNSNSDSSMNSNSNNSKLKTTNFTSENIV